MGSSPVGQRYCRCGGRLAADNTEDQCAPCERASRDKLIAPPEVPAEFWQTEQLCDAFTQQHMGQVARAYRLHPHHQPVYGSAGISQWGARSVAGAHSSPDQPDRDWVTDSQLGYLGVLGANVADTNAVVVVQISWRSVLA